MASSSVCEFLPISHRKVRRLNWMSRKYFVVTAVASLLTFTACSSDSNGVAVGSAEVSGDRPLTSRPDSSETVDVFENFIAVQRVTPDTFQLLDENLLTNAGFEEGTQGWYGCTAGAIQPSSDAQAGEGALRLLPNNCFFRSIEARPRQAFSLSCHVKLADVRAWTGMGLEFAGDDFTSLAKSPIAVATSGDYIELTTVATAPAGTSSVNLWIHSDHGATVDSCRLVDATETPAALPEAMSDNLLENGDFTQRDVSGLAEDWSVGCGGTAVASSNGLFLSDTACVDQAFSPDETQRIAAQQFEFSCYVADVEGYSDMSVHLDGELVNFVQIGVDAINTRVSLPIERSTASNGFVSLYSEGFMRVQDCAVVTVGGNTGTGELDQNSLPGETITIAGPTTSVEPNVPETIVPIETSATYRLSFNAEWSSLNHPTNFPTNAHFSGLAGAVHNSEFALWGPGISATPGIKLMAETGDASILLEEVGAGLTAASVAQEIAGGGIPLSPDSVSVEFEVTTDHPLITVTTMVAPSPDWFVGVHDLPLFDGTSFVESLTVDMVVYDAGTDSGTSFVSPDIATTPAQTIRRLTTNEADTDFVNGLPDVGQFVIERIR